jgi:hypothetical protein
MIRFAFGLALLTLAVIIGSFRFFENRDMVEKLNKQLVKAEATQLEARRLEGRVTRTKEIVLKRGQDQLSAIQRALGLDKLRSLEFRFLSETNSAEQANRYFYQHGFEIEGLVNFFDAAQLIDRIDSTPGFTINFICFKCKAGPADRESKPDEYMLTLRGTIYVYNDSRI